MERPIATLTSIVGSVVPFACQDSEDSEATNIESPIVITGCWFAVAALNQYIRDVRRRLVAMVENRLQLHDLNYRLAEIVRADHFPWSGLWIG